MRRRSTTIATTLLPPLSPPQVETNITSNHQEPDTVWPSTVALRVDLGLVRHLVDQSKQWHGSIEEHLGLERLVSHVVAEHTSVTGQTSESNPNVVVDTNQLLLVRGQF